MQDLARSGQPPHVLLDSLRFLATRGLTTTGLFSSPVNKRQLLALKESYDAGRRALRSARVVNNLEPAAAANLLLLWLGALPEPLFPAEHIPAVFAMHAHTAPRSERIADMRTLLKRTEPFIVEALFPLFELLHHYWINQSQREETLMELASIFAAPVFGTPSEHPSSPPDAAHHLIEAASLLISEYRPLFTQPYNLQRYEADLLRQASAAEAKNTAAEVKRSSLDLASSGLSPISITASTSTSTSSEWSFDMLNSPLLTPRRMHTLSVMQPAEPLLGCSPDESSAIWSMLPQIRTSSSSSSRVVLPSPFAECDGPLLTSPPPTAEEAVNNMMEALLDGMLASTVSAAFSGAALIDATRTTAAIPVLVATNKVQSSADGGGNGADGGGGDAALVATRDRKSSPVSIMFGGDSSGHSTDDSVSPCDMSRDVSDTEAELMQVEAMVAAAAVRCSSWSSLSTC